MSDLRSIHILQKQHGQGIVQNLFRREISGNSLHRANPYGSAYPDRFRMSVEQIIPQSALEAGNVFMGFTDCGRFLLSYTARENYGVSWGDYTFTYKLHFWLFAPYKPARKVTSVILFDNNGVCDNNLLIEISQWKQDDTRILVTGHSANPEGDPHHSQYFATIATIPPSHPCHDCQYVLDEDEEDFSDGKVLQPCLRHGLTIHLTFDHVSPFPKFDANIQMRYRNSVTFNTGNVLHVFSFKLLEPVHCTASSPRSDFAPPLTPVYVNMIIPYLKCDLWFKSSYSLNTIVSKGPIRDDTKILDVEGNWRTTYDRDVEEQNMLSVNAQESLLALLPYMNSVNEDSARSTTACSLMRRSSQSSLDSSDLSLNSPNPPKSPSPFRSEVAQCNDNNNANRNSTAIPTISSSSSSPSKQKLMLPPQERKFFKRRVSSVSPSASVATSPVKNEPATVYQRKPLANEAPVKGETSNSAYDIFDILGDDVLPERSFSSFRKRRLADKKYEFSEADLSTENIIPLKLCRKKKVLRNNPVNNSPNSLAGLGSPRSPRYEIPGGESPKQQLYDSISCNPRSPRGVSFVMSPVMSPNSELDVLRPINNNLNSNVVKPPSFSPRQFDDAAEAELEKRIGGYYCGNESRSRSSTPKRSVVVNNPTLHNVEDKGVRSNGPVCENVEGRPTISASINCVAKVLRSYIQRDDDNLSVITDIEDECNLGYSAYPVALPLDVHGTAYGQLNMISNAKAEKCQVPVVQLLQRTLDIELLCNEVAGMICHSAEKHYCSCCDYDAAIVDVCPERGTITAVVYVLVQAASLNYSCRANADKNTHFNLGYQDLKSKYEAVFSFAWEPSKEQCRILYTGKLTELTTVADPWHPTKHIHNLIKTRMSKQNIFEETKVLTNQLAVHDFLSVEELADSRGMITVYKDDSQKTERRFVSLGFSSTSHLTATSSTTSDSSDDED